MSHIHTRRSYDAWIRPEQIVAFARRFRFDIVLVTDHNTHRGSIDCRNVAGPDGPFFPMGAEYRSSSGDMIATFLTSPIATRDPMGIIAEAHAQSGLVVLPHPFKHSRFSDQVFAQADLIEVFNSRCSDDQNAEAREAAERFGKPGIVGADAHQNFELGLAANDFFTPDSADFKRTLLECERRFTTQKTTTRSIRSSQMLSALRRGQPVALAKNFVRWAQARPGQTP